MQADVNYGRAVLNPAPCGLQATVAITGMGRSGTTMVARVLDALGIYLGDDLSARFMEDQAVLKMVKKDRFADLAALCRARDATRAKWAFKCPALRGKLDQVHPLLRAPRYIVPFRDVMAVSQRNALSVGTELADALGMAARGYVKLLSALDAIDAPVLLLSYEKALQYPGPAVLALANFCGLCLTPAQADRIAATAIRNSDPLYFAPAGETS